jgi:hypothetical protein
VPRAIVMAETSYAALHTVLRVAVPDQAAAIAGAAERLQLLTAGNAHLAPEGTEWVDAALS